MAYNITANFSDHQITGFLHFTNYVLEGWFMHLILITLFSILLFITLKNNYTTARAFAGAAFATLLASFMLKMMNFASDYAIIVCVVICVGSVIMLLIESKM